MEDFYIWVSFYVIYMPIYSVVYPKIQLITNHLFNWLPSITLSWNGDPGAVRHTKFTSINVYQY